MFPIKIMCPRRQVSYRYMPSFKFHILAVQLFALTSIYE
uniref:Uncharacterized protein n=1 Tax=Arundo donax TaxID=35708 RepID=A0A0A9AJP1_ARUDO